MPADDFHLARKVADLERRIARLEEESQGHNALRKRLMAFLAAVRALLDSWLYEIVTHDKRRDQS